MDKQKTPFDTTDLEKEIEKCRNEKHLVFLNGSFQERLRLKEEVKKIIDEFAKESYEEFCKESKMRLNVGWEGWKLDRIELKTRLFGEDK